MGNTALTGTSGEANDVAEAGDAAKETTPPDEGDVDVPEQPKPPTENEATAKKDNSMWENASSQLISYLSPSQLSQKKSQTTVTPGQDLASDANTRNWSLIALEFNVVASAVNTKLLNPNFAIMASPGAHEDSFDDTEPFDFNSATYFMPLASLMGVAIASIFTGQWSDKWGRKRIIQVSTLFAGFGSIGMYLARDTFWGFCGASFVAGLFKGTLPVAMAYVGDVFTTKKEKSDQLSFVVGCYVLGNSGGGVFAILMEDTGLFTPLLLGAAFVFVSFVINIFYLVEPSKDVRYAPVARDKLADDVDQDALAQAAEKQEPVDDDDDVVRPEVIDKVTFWHIIMGAFADNVGSTALFPLCLSPLALEQYYSGFVGAEPPEDPIMTLTAYKWLSVCVALMVIPGTLITPRVFSWIGAAGGCVFGNIATGLLTMALLFIGNGPATTGMFAFFVIVMYLGFPFTVVSQLSTGPMLDMIAPVDKIGYVQGMNNTVMNMGMAISPWVFGVLADIIGTNPAIWIGIGVSFGAGLINWPLMWKPGLGPPNKKVGSEKHFLQGEDESFVNRALDGSFVDPEALHKLNLERLRNGEKLLIPGVRSYEEDKERLPELRSHARATFEYRRRWQDEVLAKLADPEMQDKVPEICAAVNKSLEGDEEDIRQSHEELGKWFADYIRDAGLQAQVQPTMIKQMILLAFPPVNLGNPEVTPENIQQMFIDARRTTNTYLDVRTRDKYSMVGLLGNGGAPVYYS